MKIVAGWKFQRRNPSSDPARAKHRTATYGWPTATVSEMTPSVTAAISPTPDDRPSSPSIQLMLLIMPRIQNTVSSPRPPRRRRGARAPRVADEVDADADRHRRQGKGELAEALPARPQLVVVVGRAEEGRNRAAREQRRELRYADAVRHRDDVEPVVHQGQDDDHDDECRGDREPAAPRHG